MKIVLAAVGFINGATEYNKQKLLQIIKTYSGKADMIVFGETFLQGFDALTWHYEQDKNIGISIDDDIINEIRSCVRSQAIAVSFGYIERAEDALFSSQLTIGADGTMIDNFRRVSIGWKEKCSDHHYREGSRFSCFSYHGIRFAVGLCGDLWYDENTAQMKQLGADIVLWPVYTDFDPTEWNTVIKHEYAEQAAGFCKKVLCVNSVCLDPDTKETAQGGAAFFQDGRILQELPAGSEGCLITEIPFESTHNTLSDH